MQPTETGISPKPEQSSSDAPPKTGVAVASNGSVAESSSATLRKIVALRNGAAVKRFHTKPIIGEITNGQHLFGAVSLLLVLHPNPTLTLIKATLWHDMAEYHVGDTPAPVLWRDPVFREHYVKQENAYLVERIGINMDHLSEEEHMWLLGVDKLDCYFWSREQIQLGNLGAKRTLRNLEKWFNENLMNLPMAVVSLYVEVRRYSWDDDLEVMSSDA